MIKSHLPNFLTCFKQRINNAVAAGLHLRMQTVMESLIESEMPCGTGKCRQTRDASH